MSDYVAYRLECIRIELELNRVKQGYMQAKAHEATMMDRPLTSQSYWDWELRKLYTAQSKLEREAQLIGE